MMSRQKNMEFGLVIALALSVLAYGWQFPISEWIIIVLTVTLLAPQLYTPFSWIWFQLGGLLGKVMSYVILLTVFGMLVVPVGKIRSWYKKDLLQRRQFKKDSRSVFINLYKTYQASSFKKQY